MLVIDGAGNGHGVGMSQVGAEGLAEHGYSYQQILAHYYTGTSIAPLPSTPEVSVLLAGGRRSVSFRGAGAAATLRLHAASTYLAFPAGESEIVIEGPSGRRHVLPTPVLLSGSGPLTLLARTSGGVKDGQFDGQFELVHTGRRIDVIDDVDLEDYVRGVVPAESPATWQPAELEAQAVAARGYAVTTRVGPGFDLYGDTRSQAYGGVGAETATTNAAVAATAGEVVTYDGVPVTTYYFASSGGETEDVQNSFIGAQPEPWLVSVPDPFDDVRFGPISMTLAKAAHRLGPLLRGKLQQIEVTQRGVTPRVVSAEVVGSAGTTMVSGPQLEAALGLPSAWACFSVTGPAGTPPSGWDSACAPRPASGASGSSGAP